MRRIVTIGVMIGALAWLGSPANAQRVRDRYPDDPRITGEIDRGVQQAMNEAQQSIKQGHYVPAVMRLQLILDHSEDYFLQKDFQGKNGSSPTVKTQTQRILAELPAEGQAAYELHFGPTARALLTDAMLTNDLDKMAQVVSRYPTTLAGFEAMQVLVASAFDHGRFVEAGLLCEAMVTHPKAHKESNLSASKRLTATLLMQAAFAWHLAGQNERSLSALKAMDVSATSLWRVGGQQIPPFRDEKEIPQWMSARFGPPLKPLISTMHDWRLPRGGITGNESAMSACPAGGGAWMISPLQYARFAVDGEANQRQQQTLDQLTFQIEKTLREDNRLTQPAAIPIIVGDVVVFRTLNDVTAVSLRTGQLLWRSSVTDGMLAWLFQSPTADPENSFATSPMTLPGYLRHKLFRDQLSGSLSSDGKAVYAVEESDSQFSVWRPRSRPMFAGQFIGDPANKLVAYDLQGGRILWEIGGLRGTPPVDLSGIFFLGPPLPFAGRLYCLAEVKDEVRLLALIPEANSVRLDWSQSLIAVRGGGIITPSRRSAGMVPALTDGIMVCPTSSGSVVAFDLLKRQLQWGYSYEPIFEGPKGHNNGDAFEVLSPFPVDEEDGRWLDGGPLLANGRVVITPRDSAELHCLNLVDGTLSWKRPRERGLYVAFINDDVVIVVGRTQIVAYSLADGSDVWAEPLEIPEPSGRGIRQGSHYLLPLSTGEIATLDLSSGRLLGRSRLPEGSVPGNLAVGNGALVSCGTHNVIGFRSLGEVLQQIELQLRANPKDAEALALRGELRLHHGEQDSAISDLRESLQQQPQDRVKRFLAGTMLTVLRNDSPRLLKSAAELETLIDEPRQKIEFLRLHSKALADAGDRVGAVNQLFRLSAIPQLPDEPTAIGPGHFLSIEQSIRSQLFSIDESAKTDERLEIGRIFAREFEAAMAAQDDEHYLARLVKLTVGHPAADPLLRRLADSKEPSDESIRTNLLERMSQSPTRTTAAFAIAKLAERSIAANSPREALPWIEQLGQDYPSEICLNGKTGRQISEDWLSRDDLRQSKAAGMIWPEGSIEAKRTTTRIASAFPVPVITEVGHHFAGWSFEMDLSVGGLTARDPSLRVAWRLPLVKFTDVTRIQSAQLHIRGQYLAFSSGTWIAVMKSTDPYAAPKLLFEKPLQSNSVTGRKSAQVVSRRLFANGRQVQSVNDPRGPAGFLIGMSDEAVFYQLDNRLFAVAVDTGHVLWFRIGQEFAKSNATVDRTLTLHTATNDAVLLRPMDGMTQQRHKGWLNELPLWFGGTRRLRQRPEERDQQILEMHDFDGDKIVWQNQYPAGTQVRMIDRQEVAALEPSGRLTILTLATGETKLTAELPITRPLGSGGELAVQRFEDRYLVVGGVSPRKIDTRIVATLGFVPPPDTSSFTVDGHVCAIGRSDGRLLWSVPVEQLAFDLAQPSRLPVLVLAARISDTDRFIQRMSVLILDKRSGRKIYETQESAIPVGRAAQYVPMIEDRKIIVDFQQWGVELTFAGEAK